MIRRTCTYALHEVGIDVVQRSIEQANNCPIVELSAYKIVEKTLVLLRLQYMFSQLRHIRVSTVTLTILREDSPKDCSMSFLEDSGSGNPK